MHWITEQFRLFLVAWQFFTRVPLAPALEQWVAWTPERLRASARYFPMVGSFVGLVGAAVFFIASKFFSSAIAAVLTIAITALLTGGFHEDGLADYFDSFGAAGDRAKALAIMKDSRIGSFGALALILFTVIKVAALSNMALVTAMIAIVGAHMLGRSGACVLMETLDYVRDDHGAKSKPLAEKMTSTEIFFAVACGIAPLVIAALLFSEFTNGAIFAVTFSIIFIIWFRRHLKHCLGGFTGDTLGAAEQVVETLVLLGFAARLG
jgi:adenosylcobinamide-GDP ribazoletransferase